MVMLAAIGALALIWASSKINWHAREQGRCHRPKRGSPGGRGPAQRVPGTPEIGVDRPFKVLDANAAIR
jgi:hypothetical protein